MFKALSVSERERFINFVTLNSSPSDFKFIVYIKLANGIICPYCGAKGKACARMAFIPMVVLVLSAITVISSSLPRPMEFSTTPKKTSPFGKNLSLASFMVSPFVSPLKFVA